MQKKNLFGILILIAYFASCNQIHKTHYENGWYHILSQQKDSIAKESIVTVKDFVSLRMDSDENGTCVIVGQISKHKLKKWAKETEKAIGKHIAFVLDDTIESIFKGWEKDSIYYSSKEKADSIVFAIDYWEASEWVDMSVNPEDHYWWGDLDTATYSKLESALCEEIAKPNFSSRAEDYMKLDTYKRYKAYLCENADYINLMFQGFLFTEPATGLCGFLVDDIVRSRYPTAPSIRVMTLKIDNQDDEMFAKLKYQKAIWRLMNKERDAKSNKQ